MCLHDHDHADHSAVAPSTATSRRGFLATAAVMAGVTSAAVTTAGASDRAFARTMGGPRQQLGRPPVPAPLVISGGTLVDPLTGEATADAVVVLAGGRVLAAGSRDATREALRKVAGSARRIDASGRWVVPGLVDAHVHVNALADAAAVLAAGATTARSGSSTFFQDVAMRPLASWAPGRVPTMLAAGVFVSPQLGDTVLADPDLAPLAALPEGVRSIPELRYLTRVNVNRGVNVVKTRANPRAGLPDQDPRELVYDEDQISAVVQAAGNRGVLCHAYSAEGIHGAVRAGVRSIEHGVFVSEQTMHLMARRGTYFTPTMSAIVGLLESPDPVLAARGREYVPILRDAVQHAHARGVPIVAGTDSFGTAVDPIGGEVALLVQAGLSPLDGLRAATTTAARLIGRARSVGRLEAGFVADALVLRGNPLEDPSALTRIDTVIAQGEPVSR